LPSACLGRRGAPRSGGTARFRVEGPGICWSKNTRAATAHSVSSTKIRAPTSAALGDAASLCGGAWLSVSTASFPAGMDMAGDSLLALAKRAARSISLAGIAGPIPTGAARLGGSGAVRCAGSGARSASAAQCNLDLSMPGSPAYQHFLLSISRQAH